MMDLADISARVIACERCPRLRAYCREVARTKRAAFRDQEYWGLPVPGFGDPRARLILVGLAPAAHGANRTGRMFTGDRSGDFLYAALHRAGFANQPRSAARGDGLELRDAYISAAVRCAPPENRPLPEEFDHCRQYLLEEISVMRRIRVFLALGALAHRQLVRALIAAGRIEPRARFRFAHGACDRLPGGAWLMASYHPSQQNTFTGILTAAMLDRVLRRARQCLASQQPSGHAAGRRPAGAALND